jgi:hypothetical protein
VEVSVQPLQRVATVDHPAVAVVEHLQTQAHAQLHLFRALTVAQVFSVLTVLLVVVVVQAKQATQTVRVSAVTAFRQALLVPLFFAVVVVVVEHRAVQHQMAAQVVAVTVH